MLNLINIKNNENEIKTFQRKNLFRANFIFISFTLTLTFLVLDIVIGSQGLSFNDVLYALFHINNSTSSIIIWDVRLPMSLMAPFIGGALAVSGAQMQTTLNNQLADPYTFGISSAASLGAGLVITNIVYIPGIPLEYQVTILAFIFSMMTIVLLTVISNIPRISIEGVMLFGIALMFSYDALLILVQYIASETELQTLTFWKMGSLARGSWNKIAILAITIPLILLLIMKDSWKLSALKMGEQRAKSLGINTKKLRNKNLFLISILTALSVSFCGAIGFIGLIAPHITRMMIGEDQRFFIPASFFVGAILLEVASILSKTLLTGIILPLTVVMSFVGVPFFIYLIIKKGGSF